MDLVDIYRTFHPKAAGHTFLSIAHGTFSRTDHMLGHKVRLGKSKKIEIVSSVPKKHKYVTAKRYATEQPVDH